MVPSPLPVRSRWRRAAVAVAVAAIALTGCGAPESAAPAPSADGAFPVTIPHAFGETTIPAEPTRVVAVGFNEADFVLALGVVPVGVRDFIGAFDEEAEEAIATTQQAFADARAANPGFAGRDVAIDLVVEDVPFILGADDLRSAVFTGIGLTVPDTTVELSPETLGQLDRDTIVVLGATEQDLAGDALFQGLGAVQQGRTVYTGGYDGEFAGAIGFGSPLSLPYAVYLITPQLAGVLG